AFRTGLFSIGAQGQLVVGAFSMAVVGASAGSMPPFIVVPLCLAAGAVGGGLWGAIPGILKARYGAHEVINTMMMNFVAAGLVSYLVNNVFAVPATVHTREIVASSQLPRVEEYLQYFKGSPVNLSLIIALMSCVLTYFLFASSRI